MADPRRLKIRVQTDRLPDVAGKAQIALRVSACVEGADGALAAGAVDEILPWRWRSAAAGAAAWDPHTPVSWKIWAVDPAAGGGPVEVVGAQAAVVGALAAAIGDFDADGRFAARRDAEIAAIVVDGGLEAAVASPAGASELTARSVFGLVESLTGLPHPVGAAARVFTVFTLDPAPVSPTLRYVAAPLFAPAGGGDYDFAAGPPGEAAGSAGAIYRIPFAARAGPAPMFADGDVDMRLSLSGAEIARPADPERLIDMSTMQVLKPARGHGLLDEDFAAPLARRLAEAVDPWARALGALDSAVTAAIADDPRFLRALKADLDGAGPSWLLAALDALAWRALGPRAGASPAAAPAMATWLHGIAGRRPEFWPAVAPLILGAADRGLAAPDGDRGRFASVPAARLRGLVGLSGDAASAGEAAAIDGDDGLRRFAARRWLGGADPAPASRPLADGASRAIAAAFLDLPPAAAAFGAGAVAPTPAPLLDLERAAAAAPATLAFALEFAPPPDVDFTLRLAFRQPPGRPPAPEVVLTGRAGGGAYDVDAVGRDGTQARAALPRGDALRIVIALARVDGAVEARLTAAGGAPVDAGALLTAPFYLELRAAGTALDIGVATTDQTATSLRAAFDRVASGQALRAEFAFAAVGPYLPGLLAGRLTWDAPQPADERDRLARMRLDERLAPSVAALVGAPAADGSRPAHSLFDRLRDAALAAAAGVRRGASERPALVELFGRLIEAARADAVRLARALAQTLADPQGAGDDLSRRLTVDARPLAFRFDQLQGVADDLWTRLSGLGVLMARTRTLLEPVVAWRSLNVATLHAPPSGPRPALGPDNAVAVRGGGGAAGAIVDPVALQVGEIAGARAAILAYENRSPVAQMATDATPENAPSTYARRIEAYAFPRKTTPHRLPALSFGYAFHVAPYVIGQGGALPPALRATPLDPLTMAPVDAAGAFAGQVRLRPGGDSERRSALYRRTRPIGAPRLVAAAPGVPEGVDPLAGELPIRPAPVTLGGVVEGRWFLDADGRGGVIDLPPGPFPGLRLDVGQVDWSPPGAARRLTVRLIGRKGDSEAVVDLLPAALVLDLAQPCALRIETTAAASRFAVAAPPDFAEDAFAFSAWRDLAQPAADIASWRDVGVFLAADAEIDIEPALATPLTAPAAPGPYLEAARPRIAPEAGHQKRAITLLDGINLRSAKAEATLRLRRPAVEFSTYERWVNPPLFELALDAGRDAVAGALDAARRAAGEAADAPVDRSLDDPAVTQLYVEVVRIFPRRVVVGFVPVGSEWAGLPQILGFEGAARRGHDVTFGLKAGEVEALAPAGATLAPGLVYEVRVYAGAPERQDALAPFARDERLSAAVRATLRRCPLPGAHAAMRLAGPLALTVEVATAAVPDIFGSNPLDVEWRRPPLKPEAAGLRLADAFVQRFYPTLRYCRIARLEAQRWSWRGRPQDDLWPTGAMDDLFATAFSDRGADDVGRALERPIERAHAYAGRPRRDAPPETAAPDLFELGLDWRGGANLWRFGLAVVSRYRALSPGQSDLVKFSHRTVGETAWRNEPLLDRPFDRPLTRPALALVLPLTEPVMAAGAVPPMLALFNEQLYAAADASDGIEALVEVARHPFPLAERLQARLEDIDAALPATPGDEKLLEERTRLQAQLATLLADPDAPGRLKYWAEWGPDPIRSGAGSEGALLPLRLDGPIGYGFDFGAVSGRFDHAGLLVTPVDPRVWSWSFVKLKFRRFEAPEAIDPEGAFTAAGPAPDAAALRLCAPSPLPGDGTAHVLQLQNDRALMRAGWPRDFADLANRPADSLVFACEHQGLALDLVTSGLAHAVVEVHFAKADGAPDEEWTRVEFTGVAEGIDCALSTRLGPAGRWRLPTPPGADVRLRLVLSARDKPQTGGTYRPAGDVALRARVGVSSADRLSGETENRWLAIASAPLTAAGEFAIASPLRLVVTATGAPATVAPARLSSFTPAVWCQFAEAMSRFDATVDGRPLPLVAADLEATLDGTRLAFAYRNGRLDALAPAAQPPQGAASAQVEETFALIVTNAARDAFNRLRERPVAAMAWDPKAVSLDLAGADWPAPRVAADFGAQGQARFVRLLRPRVRAEGGFVDAAPKFPQDFFPFATIDGGVDMNPPDAAGLILGMSKPIAWLRKS